MQRRRRDAERVRSVEETRRQMEAAVENDGLLGYVPQHT